MPSNIPTDTKFQEPRIKKCRKKDIAFISLLCLLVSVFFFDAIFTPDVFYLRDLFHTFRPGIKSVLEQWKSEARMPTWSAGVMFGTPACTVAIPWGLLSPTTLAYLLLSFDSAFKLHILVHYYIGAIGMYLLARSMKLPPMAAFVAGTVFTFGGYFVSVGNLYGALASVGWAPLAIMAILKAGEFRTLKWIAASAVFLALQSLGGDPSIVLMTVLVAFVLAFRFEKKFLPYDALKLVLIFACVGALAVSLAMVQFLPWMHALSESPRASGLSGRVVMWNSLDPVAAIELFIPHALGDPGDLYEGRMLWKTAKPYYYSLYVGFLSFFLSIMALTQVKKGLVRKCSVIALIALLFMVGDKTPVFSTLCSLIPLLKIVRFPIKHFFMFSTCIALLAGWATEFIRTTDLGSLDRPARKRLAALAASFAAVMFLCLAIWVFGHRFKDGILSCLAGANGLALSPDTPQGLLLLNLTLDNALARARDCAIIGLAGLAIMWLTMARRIGLALSGILYASILILDLFSANIHVNKLASGSLLDSVGKPLALTIQEDHERFRILSCLDFGHPIPSGRVYVTPDASILWRNLHCIEGLAPLTGLMYGLEYGFIYDQPKAFSARVGKMHSFYLKRGLREQVLLYSLTNVKYVVSEERLDDQRLELVDEFPSVTNYSLKLYRNREVLPRAYIVPDARAVESDDETLLTLVSQDFDPRNEVLLSSPGADIAQDSGESADPKPMSATCEILSYESDDVRIRAASDRACYLVLLDACYPDWHAHLDGKEVKIERANFAFRAVRLPPGEHQVRFEYRPVHVWVGMWWSVAAALIAVALLVMTYLRNRVLRALSPYSASLR